MSLGWFAGGLVMAGGNSTRVKTGSVVTRPVSVPILSVVVALLVSSAGNAAEVVVEPRFVETNCASPALPPPASKRLRCGTVEVPRLYGKPDSGTYKLAVAIMRSATSPAPAAAPLLLLPGGPGLGAVTGLGPAAADPAFPPAVLQDVVLVDQRGSGLSEPQVCDRRDFVTVAAPDWTTAQMLESQRQESRACLDTARRMGIAPESFGTDVAIEDLERVRRALGIQRWNVLGVSYDTLTGIALAEKYPQSMRALILDSVMDMRATEYHSLDEKFARARRALIEECASNPACRQKYPRLQEELADVLRMLERRPLVLALPPGMQAPANRLVLNRGDFEILVFTALYGRGSSVPALIRAVNEGRGDELMTAMMATSAQGRAIALFPFLAVPCRDDGARSFYAGRGKPVAGYYLLDPAAACGDWTHSVLPPVVPKRIDVPTLVLAGQLDPITPPAYGRRAATRLGPATTFVEVPSVGHGAASQSACAASIVDRFIEAPTRPVDSSCLTRTPPMDFK